MTFFQEMNVFRLLKALIKHILFQQCIYLFLTLEALKLVVFMNEIEKITYIFDEQD